MQDRLRHDRSTSLLTAELEALRERTAAAERLVERDAEHKAELERRDVEHKAELERHTAELERLLSEERARCMQ